MTKDTIQNIFIGILLGGVILLAGGVYYLAMQVQTSTAGIARIEQNVMDSMKKADAGFSCIDSGGSYEGGQCACGQDYFLENGMCMGQDGLTKKQLEEIKANQERMMMDEKMMRGTDDNPKVFNENVSVRPWPLDWTVTKNSVTDVWQISNADNQNVGIVECREGLSTDGLVASSSEKREYARGSQSLLAQKITGRPLQDTGTEVWLTAGWPTVDTDASNGCIFRFDVTPPSNIDLEYIDLIYEGIQ